MNVKRTVLLCYEKGHSIIRGDRMSYFNYHATAKRLITEGKLIDYYFTERYKNISPALVLVFDDCTHPIMPIREHRFDEYMEILKRI